MPAASGVLLASVADAAGKESPAAGPGKSSSLTSWLEQLLQPLSPAPSEKPPWTSTEELPAFASIPFPSSKASQQGVAAAAESDKAFARGDVAVNVAATAGEADDNAAGRRAVNLPADSGVACDSPASGVPSVEFGGTSASYFAVKVGTDDFAINYPNTKGVDPSLSAADSAVSNSFVVSPSPVDTSRGDHTETPAKRRDSAKRSAIQVGPPIGVGDDSKTFTLEHERDDTMNQSREMFHRSELRSSQFHVVSHFLRALPQCCRPVCRPRQKNKAHFLAETRVRILLEFPSSVDSRFQAAVRTAVDVLAIFCGEYYDDFARFFSATASDSGRGVAVSTVAAAAAGGSAAAAAAASAAAASWTGAQAAVFAAQRSFAPPDVLSHLVRIPHRYLRTILECWAAGAAASFACKDFARVWREERDHRKCEARCRAAEKRARNSPGASAARAGSTPILCLPARWVASGGRGIRAVAAAGGKTITVAFVGKNSISLANAMQSPAKATQSPATTMPATATQSVSRATATQPLLATQSSSKAAASPLRAKATQPPLTTTVSPSTTQPPTSSPAPPPTSSPAPPPISSPTSSAAPPPALPWHRFDGGRYLNDYRKSVAATHQLGGPIGIERSRAALAAARQAQFARVGRRLYVADASEAELLRKWLNYMGQALVRFRAHNCHWHHGVDGWPVLALHEFTSPLARAYSILGREFMRCWPAYIVMFEESARGAAARGGAGGGGGRDGSGGGGSGRSFPPFPLWEVTAAPRIAKHFPPGAPAEERLTQDDMWALRAAWTQTMFVLREAHRHPQSPSAAVAEPRPDFVPRQISSFKFRCEHGTWSTFSRDMQKAGRLAASAGLEGNPCPHHVTPAAPCPRPVETAPPRRRRFLAPTPAPVVIVRVPPSTAGVNAPRATQKASAETLARAKLPPPNVGVPPLEAAGKKPARGTSARTRPAGLSARHPAGLPAQARQPAGTRARCRAEPRARKPASPPASPAAVPPLPQAALPRKRAFDSRLGSSLPTASAGTSSDGGCGPPAKRAARDGEEWGAWETPSSDSDSDLGMFVDPRETLPFLSAAHDEGAGGDAAPDTPQALDLFANRPDLEELWFRLVRGEEGGPDGAPTAGGA